MESEELQRHKEILRTFLENPDPTLRAISTKLGMVHSTVSRVLNRYHERLTIDRNEKSYYGSQSSSYSFQEELQAFSSRCGEETESR